ncbi:MAG: SH3-like domain-containing protein [Hyphomicrobiaceae bacterium]|jgi:nitrile hydratase
MSTRASPSARFAVGDRVVVASRPPHGHCRTPWYLRGRSGTVASIHGAYHDPERLAYHKPGLPLQTLYKVRFLQADLWQTYRGPSDDHLEADIYEDWLEATP